MIKNPLKDVVLSSTPIHFCMKQLKLFAKITIKLYDICTVANVRPALS